MCYDTQRMLVNLSINENKYFQSCHASRDNTCAGFESAPLVSVEKGSSSIIKYEQAYTTVCCGNTIQTGVLLT
jgi:hypothetical protein